MADLPKEYEAIRKQTIERAMSSNHPVVAGNMIDAVNDAVERCYALHSQPPKELTDTEIDAINDAEFCDFPLRDEAVRMQERRACRAVIAAHIAKQREPEVVEFRAARHTDGGVRVFASDETLPSGNWQWLDHDGKPQTFKVVV